MLNPYATVHMENNRYAENGYEIHKWYSDYGAFKCIETVFGMKALSQGILFFGLSPKRMITIFRDGIT